ncbi:hypothetical protein F5146DRAFT_935028 [Armillaria mellea]|nr:hypothetical protein F5146DRAFT_935028 [Armillaria mellea]
MDLATASQQAPRAYIRGCAIPVDYKMPDLALVRDQAAKVAEVVRAPIPSLFFAQNTRGVAIGPIPLALWYNFELPQLFMFSYFCAVEDVPEDILPQCVWALDWTIRMFLEASDEQLKTFAHIAPQGQGGGITADMERYASLQICRCKLAEHLLTPQMNQPLEALRHIQCAMELDQKRYGKSADIFVVNPGLYASFAVCLARARSDDLRAKAMLSHVMNDITFEASFRTIFHRVEAKVYLARVLRRLREDSEAHKLEEWLVKWFKKHPHEFANAVLLQMFTTDIDPGVDPVFTGLGGTKWLSHRKATAKTLMRQAKNCRNCRACEPQVKLSLCSKCQHTYYCSRDCQKMNWRYHNFREDAEHGKKIAEVERISISAAQQLRDWQNYRDNPRPETIECFAHALGIARDASRGRTHIIYQEVEYVPSVKNRLDKFRSTRVGVFKLDDVWQDLESRMGLGPGKGKVYVREMLEEFDLEPVKGRVGGPPIPLFNLMFSAKNTLPIYLGMSRISQQKLVFMRPNPDWRRALNMKDDEPPAHFKLSGGKIQDAEFIF